MYTLNIEQAVLIKTRPRITWVFERQSPNLDLNSIFMKHNNGYSYNYQSALKALTIYCNFCLAFLSFILLFWSRSKICQFLGCQDFLTPRNSSGSCRSRHWSQMSASSPAMYRQLGVLNVPTFEELFSVKHFSDEFIFFHSKIGSTRM